MGIMDRPCCPIKRSLLCIVASMVSIITVVVTLFTLSQPLSSLATTAAAANSTLGFGAILAVSHAKSPRQKDLLYAANLTGINITIPEQPSWSEHDVDAFRSPEKSRISKGSALAWMGHLNALSWFLSTELETALILEDDVDWDIRLRTAQIPLAAAAIRQLLSNSSVLGGVGGAPYWGPLSWELLYLGHCGDMFEVNHLETLAHQTYEDRSLPPTERLHSRTSQQLGELGIPDFTRIAHRSHFPLCTFGYAVTRSSARRILESFDKEGEGGCQAFDVRILEACRDQNWACYTINPELFHHIEAPSEIANVDQGIVEDEHEKDKERTLRRLKGTHNIACGARQQTLLAEENETQEWLKEMVGGHGRCLMDQMEQDMSRWP